MSDVDGSNRVLLPRLTEYHGEPTWTKRGRLLFTGTRRSARNLYFVEPDGTGLRQLTRSGGRSGAYSNGGLIGYVARGWIRLVRPDGSGGRRFARGGSPDFSPSGRSIVYSARGALFVKRVKRRAKRIRIATEGGAPVFSPSGRRVLYEVFSNRDPNTLGTSFLVTVTPRGKRVRVIYSSDSSTGATLADPAWQPRPGGG